LKKITITLNGSEVSGNEGMSILELAQENGIYIPTLCHDPNLKPVGACRVCLVEDEKTGNHFWLNLLLTLFFFVPGMIHALWLVVILIPAYSVIKAIVASCERSHRNWG
jgi:NADH dehydrogenase/NADH:ubiquinone oxidoreductase subunit G